MRQVILRPGEDGWWVAEVLSLPGCIAQGHTREEALANAREAIDGWIESARDEGLPIPPDTFDAAIFIVGS